VTRVETKNALRRGPALVAIGSIALGVLWFALTQSPSNDIATTEERASVPDARAGADMRTEHGGDVLDAPTNLREPAERVTSGARDDVNAPAGRILRITVSDEHDQPLAGVDLAVADARGTECGRATTRGGGNCEFTIPLRAADAKDAQLAASLSTRAPGRRDAWRSVRESDFGTGESVDVHIVLGLSAELHLDLRDVAGAAAGRVIVVANWLADSDDPTARDGPDDAVNHYRAASDARGNVDLRGLLPGKWKVRIVEWREWLNSEARYVPLAPGEQRVETWTIESRPRDEYTSGVVKGLVFSGDGSDTSGFYLRRASNEQPAIAVLSDGAFFADDDRFLSEEWALYDREGVSRGGRVRLQLGQHGLVLDVPAK
jgi:hypothetical protein